ncbi:hypothetical protein, partial [Sphingomonas sp.]|uniref:hypothetical protein n=1 Tax=Sphingomonas sp. TaxID=28214 RepID=UPI0025F8694D
MSGPLKRALEKLSKPGRSVPSRRQVARLTFREYVPQAMTIALWAIIVLAIGHADTARLFAATVAMRAVPLLVRLSTASSLKARVGAPRDIRRQARNFAFTLQIVSLLLGLVIVALLYAALQSIGQRDVAVFLPLIAIGLPARALRYSDIRTDSPYFRLALAGGGLFAIAAGWAAGLGAIGIGLAFGAREWIALVIIRWWPKPAHVPTHPMDQPLEFAEVARNSAIGGRRLLTYRLTKVALAVFGPIGNFAARTSRGLNWTNRIEPYLPHRFAGFLIFALGTGAAAIILAV